MFNKEKRLLESILDCFPLVHRPFETLARRHNLTEQQCIEHVGHFIKSGRIKGISASFDLRGYGYQSCIAAMQVAPGELERAVKAVHDYPGLAYCAQRYDTFNLWLSIYVSPTEGLQQTVEVLHRLASSKETLMLPALELFKVPQQVNNSLHETVLGLPLHTALPQQRIALNTALSEQDIQLIQLFQQALPLIEMPYTVLAQQSNLDEQSLFSWAKRMEQAGVLCQFAAQPSAKTRFHTLLVGWQIPDGKIGAVCSGIVRFREVIYCDKRPVYPNWPYSVFTLIQSSTEQKCIEVLARIEKNVGAYTHKNLFTVAEYKNAPVRFFDAALDVWWRGVGGQKLATGG